jgi:predicted O-methyltransferase YrrM
LFNKYITDLKKIALEDSERCHAAIQLLEMHSHVLTLEEPRILELGVDKGQSTKVFLNALSSVNGGSLVSVDIRDCSAVASSAKWQFIQADSTDEQKILDVAPKITDGLDVIYVDSLHTENHVMKEIFIFYRHLKVGGVMYFDDVDSYPYMQGNRKDSFEIEIANRKINRLLLNIFQQNIKSLRLNFEYGSTGLAKLTKLSNEELLPIQRGSKERENLLLSKIVNKFLGRKSYQHNLTDSSSFQIDVTKYKQ